MIRVFLFIFCSCAIVANAQTVGWFYSYAGAADGYVLFTPNESDSTYLLDKCGKRIHEWGSTYNPGLSVYLLKDGTLLRCGDANNNQFMGGGRGGILEEFDWNSNKLWSYVISDANQCQHHDAIHLPNGNILAIAWEYHTKADAQDNGRVSLGTKMWSDKIVEIQPIGADSGTVVWQWRAWDHLVQDVDSTKINYGVVHDHPELIDINLGTLNTFNADWLHLNGLDYDSVHDQIMVSCHNLSEIYIIDHSTTMDEAASHTGGNSGHGGDLMYRWGNPQNYDRGTTNDRKLYQQHNSQWIPAGYPGGGKVLLFNNGVERPGTDYSTVETFILPEMVGNNYPLEPDSAYKPHAQDWIYTASPPPSLFSMVEGGAQRLMNGNTLICNANSGEFLEVDESGNTLWKYVNPVDLNGNTPQGDQPNQNDCFRVTYLPSDYPGLAGQDLTPGTPIELNPLTYSCENIPTGTTAVMLNSENLIAFPNPFRNNFTIHVPVEWQHAVLQLHDLAGRLLYEEQNISASPGEDHAISFPGYQGMMMLSVKDASGNKLWNTTVVAE